MNLDGYPFTKVLKISKKKFSVITEILKEIISVSVVWEELHTGVNN